MMPTEKKCPECGTAIPAGAPPGFCPRCEFTGALSAAPTGASPSLGTIRYFGDYELLEEIARGGMGVVYRARQLGLNRTVAVKMILAGCLATAEAVQRFRAEAAAAASLQHPNVVAIHEIGEHEGQHYFSMDFVEGQNLAQLVREGPLPAGQAAKIVKTIAEAIQFAHDRGILHRDLKPSNVLIDADGQPHVTDFGLAKRVNENSDLTHSGQVLGTPSFIAPEQAAGKRREGGPPSDVYSLGGILYHLLTGRPPFDADTIEATLAQVLNAHPVAPRSLNPAIPRNLETICLKCLEKDPQRRYPTAGELVDELGRFLDGEPILAHPISHAEKVWRWCRRNPALAGSLATVLLLLLLGGIVASTWQAIRTNMSQRAQSRARTTTANAARRAEPAPKVSFTNGLVAHYTFNGNANDESGHGNHGTILGALPTMDRFGHPNGAYQCGPNQSIQLPVSGNRKPMSLAVWFRTGNSVDRPQAIVDNDLPRQGGHSILIGFWPEHGQNRHLQLEVHQWARNWYLDSGVILRTNTVYHVVGIWSDKVTIYVNGEQRAQNDYPVTLLDGTNYRVGRHNDHDPYWFWGAVDDVRIYDRPLSALEVRQFYESESRPAG